MAGEDVASPGRMYRVGRGHQAVDGVAVYNLTGYRVQARVPIC